MEESQRQSQHLDSGSIGMDKSEMRNTHYSQKEVASQPVLDPEGGYANPEVGQATEMKAMMSQPALSVNALPTK